jgi:hypothetical protein
LPTLSATEELYFSQQAQLAQLAASNASRSASAVSSGASAIYGASRDDVNRQYKVDRHVIPGAFAQRGMIRSGLFDEAVEELKAKKITDLAKALANQRAMQAQASAQQANAQASLNLQLQQLELQKAALLMDRAAEIATPQLVI